MRLYLALRRQGNKLNVQGMGHWSRVPSGDFGGAIVALVALEALALIVVLTARVVLTRARRMLQLKNQVPQELPLVEAHRVAASEPGARQPCGRLSMILGGGLRFFYIFAVVRLPASFVGSYRNTKWMGLVPPLVDGGE